jgi:hypothetical protein
VAKVLFRRINTISIKLFAVFASIKLLCFPVHKFKVTDAKTANNLMLIAFIHPKTILGGAKRV